MMTSRNPGLNIIVAIDRNGAIGRNGNLLFHLSEDLRHFRRITTGHTVVMGRRTFESLPKGALPERRNIVVSRNPSFSAPGAEVYPSLDDALRAAAIPAGNGTDNEIFIIGGGQIYNAAFPMADKLYLTMIDAADDQADTFFPTIDMSYWQEVPLPGDIDDNWRTDPKNGLRFRFTCLSRK